VSHDRALLDAVPNRLVAIEERSLRSYDGGWADLTRERSAEPPPVEPGPKPAKKPRERPQRAERRPPSELELLEGRIAEAETRVAELEGQLATDWTNMDVLAAHRAARDELARLLERWEALFEEPETR
jgi:ATPase subunit of ABC transporter with duplicated ATPase domains